MRTVVATRYVTPLREGGSMPAIVEADDSGLYVLKFRGAGQGVKALVAELVAGELARGAGLRVPELVFVQLDPVLGRNEPDDEIRDLLRASGGINIALDYLPRSVTFDPAVGPAPEALLASRIVAFDAFVLNVDRTAKNPNLLEWHDALWLIDHGAALYPHHAWDNAGALSASPFKAVRDHVLLPWASAIREAWTAMAPHLGVDRISQVLADVPDDWLAPEGDPAELRAKYLDFLTKRLAAADAFLEEATRARLV